MREAYIENYFTVQVAHTMLDVDTRIMADEIFTHQKTHKGMIKSNEGGFQSQNINLHDAHELKDLQKAIQIESKKFSDSTLC